MRNGPSNPQGAALPAIKLEVSAADLLPLINAELDRRLAALEEAAAARPEPLMTTAELATYWSITPRTIANLRAEGLPVQFCGDSPRFNRAKVDAWAEARKAS